jgi:uncharacterized membrane protein
VTTDHPASRDAPGYEQSTSNKLVTGGWAGYNVIAVSFEEDRSAYNALTALKELDSQRWVGVQEAVVVIRREDGQVLEKDRVESMFLPSTAGGGLIGLLIGIIGGPFGMLIGSAADCSWGRCSTSPTSKTPTPP